MGAIPIVFRGLLWSLSWVGAGTVASWFGTTTEEVKYASSSASTWNKILWLFIILAIIGGIMALYWVVKRIKTSAHKK